MGPNSTEQKLLEKIRNLPPEKAAEVEDFIDFLTGRENDRRLARAATRLSEDAFAKVWENDEDADYDRL
ncbi:MAG TPA: toxin-antitoxin system, antitoxin component, Xre family protein [Planctomycetes bacterium]|nr:toxin-antitoxin system, antitoxin component, Xre family protein [Planctomycetota bacterium]